MDDLSEMEERIKHKIAQIEDEMHNTHERENTDRLIPKIVDIKLGVKRKTGIKSRGIVLLSGIA